MILVDFSHLSSRMIFVSVEEVKKNGFANRYTDEGKIDVECYRNYYLHLLFTSLGNIKKDFSKEYGEEIVLCLDGRKYWRKDIYPQYKEGRGKKRQEAKFDYKQYHALVQDTLAVIEEFFPFKTVFHERAEGDDVIAVLAKNTKDKVLIVSEDKDMKQLLKYPHVKMYRPILKEFVNVTPKELIFWKATHIVGGDIGDDVPTIKKDTEFSLNFINYLRQNEVYETNVNNFLKLTISKKLLSEYIVRDKKTGELDIYKPPRFGKVGIDQFCRDIKKGLKENPMYWVNYKRNKKLVMFDFIPQEIQDLVVETYKVAPCHYNPVKIDSYFAEYNLRQLSADRHKFYTTSNEITPSKGMFDFWN